MARELGRRQWRGSRRCNSVARAARAREGVDAWVEAKGKPREALGCLNRHGKGGEATSRR
jgi:hypothetical protein